MRTVNHSDLTRRARIRDAALALFAERGYVGTSVRAIADAAGVSSALVTHHFGSKSELRQACDEYVLAAVFDAKDELGAAEPVATIQAWMQNAGSHALVLGYLARTLVDDAESSARLLARLVSRTEAMIRSGIEAGTIRDHSNPGGLAVLVALHGLMPLVMQRQLCIVLDGVPNFEEATRQLMLPLLELYTHGLYTDSRLLDAITDSSDEREAAP